jgi:hypothetical protein
MKFKQHALLRVRQRCNLTEKDIKDKINNGNYFNFGINNKHNHLLIYSEKDDEMFVIVQDKRNFDIITLMPFNWHNKWELSHEMLSIAKKHLWLHDDLETINHELPRKIILTANILKKKYRQIYSGQKKISTKTIHVKLSELNSHDIYKMGYDKDVINKNEINKIISDDNSFLKNLKSHIKGKIYENLYDKKEKILSGDYNYIVMSFYMSLDGNTFELKELGKVDLLK